MQGDPAQALLHRQAILETLYRYCRGVDRMDRALTRACWHAVASADYRGMFTGDVVGERAASESYVTVVLRSKPGRAPARDILTRGRYVDRWSRRAGRWAIDHRIYLNDWMTFVPVPDEATSAFTGRRDSDDASYTAFAELQNGERNR